MKKFSSTFLANLPRQISKEATYKELRLHLSIMAGCITVIRATPYILHYLIREPGMTGLKLEL
ncbi:uncharacterized protein [Triticum aestivum]|uniref:uncharacterized protein n=1 Tax=Triticum aestivum TaxID=4565 RepID=UPI001D02E8C2|nr:uncharacterized protein LOC123184832 [Triticum aestivum]